MFGKIKVHPRRFLDRYKPKTRAVLKSNWTYRLLGIGILVGQVYLWARYPEHTEPLSRAFLCVDIFCVLVSSLVNILADTSRYEWVNTWQETKTRYVKWRSFLYGGAIASLAVGSCATSVHFYFNDKIPANLHALLLDSFGVGICFAALAFTDDTPFPARNLSESNLTNSTQPPPDEPPQDSFVNVRNALELGSNYRDTLPLTPFDWSYPRRGGQSTEDCQVHADKDAVSLDTVEAGKSFNTDTRSLIHSSKTPRLDIVPTARLDTDDKYLLSVVTIKPQPSALQVTVKEVRSDSTTSSESTRETFKFQHQRALGNTLEQDLQSDGGEVSEILVSNESIPLKQMGFSTAIQQTSAQLSQRSRDLQ